MDISPIPRNIPPTPPGSRADGKAPAPRRSADAGSADDALDQVEITEAVRKTSGNAQEETHEERHKHGHYKAKTEGPPERPPRIDLEG